MQELDGNIAEIHHMGNSISRATKNQISGKWILKIYVEALQRFFSILFLE